MSNEVLIVDDEADIRDVLSDILSDEGYETRTASNSTQALESIHTRQPSLVILDIWLQDSELDGMEILDVIKTEYPDLPVVMISGHGNIETAVSAVKKGAFDFIEKPFKTDHMMVILERAVETARLRRENIELRQKVVEEEEADLIGNSAAVSQLRMAIEKVSPTGSRVMISGPPGSGKEIVARQLHAHSSRSQDPFVVLNCATMHPERLEMELFGVEAGFDGEGAPARIGTFEKAHGGTLFLDEVADMPLETQGKIVRVLQEQSFTRVGGSHPVEVDVRVLSSSNKNLEEEMAAGHFREDLFFRLNVVPLKIPSLAERAADIPEMVSHFMEIGAQKAGLPARILREDTLAALQAYEWPGNVRQLRNLVDWLLIMATGNAEDKIKPDMLPPEITGKTPTAAGLQKDEDILGLSLRDARESFERDYLMAQVTRFRGNISRTASFIGMERSALHRKLKSLGVKISDRQVVEVAATNNEPDIAD
ncbi:MAG: sigma-54-dependent Fis family transcriptional regulator [Rhodospirillales bacterium]|nr:sigma-54-dependent Fis family transcriptional regulator [Rhodospirillales bacterium]